VEPSLDLEESWECVLVVEFGSVELTGSAGLVGFAELVGFPGPIDLMESAKPLVSLAKS
jgi:hypothetical protein